MRQRVVHNQARVWPGVLIQLLLLRLGLKHTVGGEALEVLNRPYRLIIEARLRLTCRPAHGFCEYAFQVVRLLPALAAAAIRSEFLA